MRVWVCTLGLLASMGCASQPKPGLTPESDASTKAAATEAPAPEASAPLLEASAPLLSASPSPAKSAVPPDRPIPRDWQRCPAIAPIQASGDLLAIGDVHGDWERLRGLLVGSGVIASPAPSKPKKALWAAGDATLVFVGDFTGKHDQSLKVISLMMTLQEQARAAGGDLIVTLGNHEAEFLAPEVKKGQLEWDKKTATFRQELEDAGLDPEKVWQAEGNKESRRVGEFLNCLPAAAASDRWFFAHAGSTEGRTLDELRRAIEEGFEDDGYGTYVLLGEEFGLLDARLSPPTSVWWQNLPESQEASRARLRANAEALGVRHIVVGHQSGKYVFNRDIVRKKARMFQLFDGTLYLIDVGISRGQKGGLSAGALLRIERDEKPQDVSVVCPNGKSHSLPPEGESKGVRCKLP